MEGVGVSSGVAVWIDDGTAAAATASTVAVLE